MSQDLNVIECPVCRAHIEPFHVIYGGAIKIA